MDHRLAAKLEKTLRKIKKKKGYYPFWYLEMDTGEPYIWVGRKPVPKNARVPPAMGKKVLQKHGIHPQGLEVTAGTLQFEGGVAELHVLRKRHRPAQTQRLIKLAAKHDHIKSLKGARVVLGEWPEAEAVEEVARSAADAAQPVDAEDNDAAPPPAADVDALVRADADAQARGPAAV